MKTIIVNEEVFLKTPDLFVKALEEFGPGTTAEDMLRTIRFNGFYFFAFDEKDNVTAWGRCAKTWRRKTMYCIRQVETKEEYRNKGYASQLYKVCEEYLKRDGIAKRIYTFVDKDNVASLRFHEKNGYSRVNKVSKEIREIHGWESAIMFEKQINKK